MTPADPPVTSLPDRGKSLSDREREVLRLVALGRSGAEIGQELGISAETVRVHVRNAMRKLGATTRAQAIGIAVSTGEI
jgi:DNA-binding CsgD family transcriptional regulator